MNEPTLITAQALSEVFESLASDGGTIIVQYGRVLAFSEYGYCLIGKDCEGTDDFKFDIYPEKALRMHLALQALGNMFDPITLYKEGNELKMSFPLKS